MLLEHMLHSMAGPYNLRYCYLLAGIEVVEGMTKRGASRGQKVFHNQKIGREIFGILQNQYPTWEGTKIYDIQKFFLELSGY